MKGSKSSGFDRVGFKAVWGGGGNKGLGVMAKNLGKKKGHQTPERRGRGIRTFGVGVEVRRGGIRQQRRKSWGWRGSEGVAQGRCAAGEQVAVEVRE